MLHDRFVDAVHAADPQGMKDALAEDITFWSPVIFKATVNGDRAVGGLDLLHFDEDGLIDELTVMLRPLSGLNAMAEAMGKRFEELGLA